MGCNKSPDPQPLPSLLESITIKSSSLGTDSITIRFRHDQSGRLVGTDYILPRSNSSLYDFYEITYPGSSVHTRYGFDKGTPQNRNSLRYADTMSLGNNGPLVWRSGQTDLAITGTDTLSETARAVTVYMYGPDGLLRDFVREGQKVRRFTDRLGRQFYRLMEDTTSGSIVVQNGNAVSITSQVLGTSFDSAQGSAQRARLRYTEIREYFYNSGQAMPPALANELGYRRHYLLDPLLFATGPRFRNLPNGENYTINYFREDGSLQDQAREERQYQYAFTEQRLLSVIRLTTAQRWEEHRYRYNQD